MVRRQATRYLIAFMFLSSSLYLSADFRPNHGGWAHAHDCEGSKEPDCEPHHHTLSDVMVGFLTRDFLLPPFHEYHTTIGLPDHLSSVKALFEVFKHFENYFLTFPRELLQLCEEEEHQYRIGTCFVIGDDIYNPHHLKRECRRLESGAKDNPPAVPDKSKSVRPTIEKIIEEMGVIEI